MVDDRILFIEGLILFLVILLLYIVFIGSIYLTILLYNKLYSMIKNK